MKLALAQLNFKIADFEANKEKIIRNIDIAAKSEADLVVFSELAICGYPPLDLLTREEFVKKSIAAMDEIAKHCTKTAAIVGGPSINPNSRGKQLFNSAWFLFDGKATPLVHKTLLPTYDIFDEYRYFQPNQTFELLTFKGKRIAITICEDLWDDQPVEAAFSRNQLYTLSPLQKLSTLRPDFVINIAASPFSYHQHAVRRQVISNKAARYHLPIFYVNQVGANTELIFDGGSMVVDQTGKVKHRLKYFKEDLHYVSSSLDANDTDIVENLDQTESIYNALVLGLKDYFVKSGLATATIGLSGGIDSAVTAALAVDALGRENVHGLLLPSQHSSDHSITDAVKLAENLNIGYDIIPIKDIYFPFETALAPVFKNRPADVTEENLQARIRGTLLMAYSNKFGHILLNTSNKSEAAVGYGTLYGDMNGGLSVLGDVYKTDVYKLAQYMNRQKEIIPVNTIVKPPSAELRPDQKDSDSLPDYDILDAILFRYIELNRGAEAIIHEGFDKATVEKTIWMVNRNEYKRFQCPPILRVSGKAFGVGRRMPIVAKY
jgi:NAD+ synthase (glutamine-hydrolysing)